MKTILKKTPIRMLLICILLTATTLLGKAQANAQQRQYYSRQSWYYANKGAHARNYYYRPWRSQSYRRHYVYYFRKYPRYAYYYSPRSWTRYYRDRRTGRIYYRTYRKGYYGRCDVASGRYQWLNDGYEQPVAEIADTEFGDMQSMGMIPERPDGPMEAPPPPP